MSKIRLLIVDDEELFLESMRKRLEVRDFDVATAESGDRALELARQKPIDVALVDLKMPGMGGEDVLKALKREHKWMEVIILTGHGSKESAAACSREGAYSYLQKPCEFERMLAVLSRAYKKRVMRKNQIGEESMNRLLTGAPDDSPLGILRKLREIDEQTNG